MDPGARGRWLPQPRLGCSNQKLRADATQALVERELVVVGIDGRFLLAQQGTSVHPLVHEHDGNASHFVASEDGCRDRGRSAVTRKERGVVSTQPSLAMSSTARGRIWPKRRRR